MAQTPDHNWPMTIDQIIATNLDALMRAFPDLGSQKLLFARSGVTTSTIGRIRRGDVSPTAQNIHALARAFGVSAADLLHPGLAARLGKDDVKFARVERIVLNLREKAVDERQLRAIEAILGLD